MDLSDLASWAHPWLGIYKRAAINSNCITWSLIFQRNFCKAMVSSAADVIILMVPDTPDVQAALFDPCGITEGLSPGITNN